MILTHVFNNAGINFIHNHPSSETNPPGHNLKGTETLPLRQLLCTKTLPSGQNRESKVRPLGHKVREFYKYIYIKNLSKVFIYIYIYIYIYIV